MAQLLIGLALATIALWLIKDKDCEHAPLQFDEATLRNDAAERYEQWLEEGDAA